MQNVKVKTLTDTYGMARRLSDFYISKLEGLDLHKQYEINGVKMNSPYWLIAHLCWTEHFLIIEGIGGTSMEIEWLNDFCFGSAPEDVKNNPAYEEVLKTREEIHTKAIEILNNLQDEELAHENNINANFGSKTNKEVVLMHAIRHEPMHIGQISWILKANGIKLT
jgi:hypothetical protein